MLSKWVLFFQKTSYLHCNFLFLFMKKNSTNSYFCITFSSEEQHIASIISSAQTFGFSFTCLYSSYNISRTYLLYLTASHKTIFRNSLGFLKRNLNLYNYTELRFLIKIGLVSYLLWRPRRGDVQNLFKIYFSFALQINVHISHQCVQ